MGTLDTNFVDELRSLGIQLDLRGNDRLVVQAQPGILTAGLKAEIAKNKPVILSLLKSEENRELFEYLKDSIQSGGPYSRLWPCVRQYMSGQLTRPQFEALETAYKQRLN